MAERPLGSMLRVERDPSAEGSSTFILDGELDMSNADALVQAVQPFAANGGEVVLRLEGLAFMDSSGIKALLQISHALGPGGRVIIDSPSPAVMQVLKIVGADRFPGFAIVTA